MVRHRDCGAATSQACTRTSGRQQRSRSRILATHDVAVAWVLLLHYTVPDRSYEYSISDTAAATTASASATRRVHSINRGQPLVVPYLERVPAKPWIAHQRVCHVACGVPGNAMARARGQWRPMPAMSRVVGSGRVLPQHLRRRRAFCSWYHGQAAATSETALGADLCSPVRTTRRRLRSCGGSSTLAVIFMIFCARTYRVVVTDVLLPLRPRGFSGRFLCAFVVFRSFTLSSLSRGRVCPAPVLAARTLQVSLYPIPRFVGRCMACWGWDLKS